MFGYIRLLFEKYQELCRLLGIGFCEVFSDRQGEFRETFYFTISTI